MVSGGLSTLRQLPILVRNLALYSFFFFSEHAKKTQTTTTKTHGTNSYQEKMFVSLKLFFCKVYLHHNRVHSLKPCG